MPEPLRKVGHFVAALCFVGGLIAIVMFLIGLGGGDVSSRSLIGLVLGADRGRARTAARRRARPARRL